VKAVLATFNSLILLFLLAPVGIVIPMAFNSSPYLQFPPTSFSMRLFRSFFTDPAWTSAALRSLEVALAATAIALALGVPAAMGLVFGQVPARKLAQTLFLAPLIVPTIVFATSSYGWYAGLNLVGTVFGLIIAHGVLTSPLVVVSVAATLQTFDIRLELAAMSLGADRVQTFGRITLPLIARGVLAGAIFAFAVSFDELILALFLLGPSDQTLPMRIWEGIRTSIDPIIAAVAALMIILAVLIALVPLLGSLRSARTATD